MWRTVLGILTAVAAIALGFVASRCSDLGHEESQGPGNPDGSDRGGVYSFLALLGFLGSAALIYLACRLLGLVP